MELRQTDPQVKIDSFHRKRLDNLVRKIQIVRGPTQLNLSDRDIAGFLQDGTLEDWLLCRYTTPHGPSRPFMLTPNDVERLSLVLAIADALGHAMVGPSMEVAFKSPHYGIGGLVSIKEYLTTKPDLVDIKRVLTGIQLYNACATA